MKRLIELLQNEKLSQRTKRFLCAMYALPPVEKGSKEVDVTVFAELLEETQAAIIACCQELQDNQISHIEELETGTYYYFVISQYELSIKLL